MFKIIAVFIITWFTLLYVRHFTHIICNVQDYSGLYNNVVHTVICEDILLILYVDYSGVQDIYNVVHTVICEGILLICNVQDYSGVYITWFTLLYYNYINIFSLVLQP